MIVKDYESGEVLNANFKAIDQNHNEIKVMEGFELVPGAIAYIVSHAGYIPVLITANDAGYLSEVYLQRDDMLDPVTVVPGKKTSWQMIGLIGLLIFLLVKK